MELVAEILMKNIHTRILLALIFLLFTFDASAMECIETVDQSVDQLYKRSDFVFEAEVVKRKPVLAVEDGLCWKYSKDRPNCGPKIVDLKIKEIWKGRLDETPTIYSEDGCYCVGSYLFEGDTHVIFAKRAEPQKPYDLIATPGCGSIELEKHSTQNKLKIKELVERP